jgi:hypothetical protein
MPPNEPITVQQMMPNNESITVGKKQHTLKNRVRLSKGGELWK